MDYSFLYDDDVPFEEFVEGYQELINSGMAWKLEGSVGRTAMDLIDDGYCTLGEGPHADYYDQRVPSRYEVEPGTKGSPEYVKAHRDAE